MPIRAFFVLASPCALAPCGGGGGNVIWTLAARMQSIAYRARSNVLGLFCGILCTLACGCGRGGGSNPPSPDVSVYQPTPTTATLLVVTNATNGTIDMLTIDTKTGVPTPIAGNPLPDGLAASAVAIVPYKLYLYVSSTSGEVRGYLINASPLGLIPMEGSPFATNAPSVAIAIDPAGQWILTANGLANTLSEFYLNNSVACGHCPVAWGALGDAAGSPFAAASDPSAIVVTSSYLYVANIAGRSVSVYRFNDQNETGFGTFAPVVGSPFPTAGSPSGLVVDPTGTHVYTTESQPNEVSGFSVATGGSLTPIPGSPFPANYSIQSPVIVAEGKRLCAANGTDVDCFLVDSNTGALTEIGVSHTNGRALALALDGPDNFLYVLDNVDNQIEVFSVNPADGSLTLIPGSPFALFPGASGQNLGPNSIAVQH